MTKTMAALSLPGSHAPSGTELAHPQHARCRQCGDEKLIRIRRRFVDRLISVVYPLKRYRCTAAGCDWEGALSRKRVRASPKAKGYA